jgi:hypothetical protein
VQDQHGCRALLQLIQIVTDEHRASERPFDLVVIAHQEWHILIDF